MGRGVRSGVETEKGREHGGVKAGHEHGAREERNGERKRKGSEQEGKRAREQENEEGVSSPFYRLGIHGCCWVIVR